MSWNDKNWINKTFGGCKTKDELAGRMVAHGLIKSKADAFKIFEETERALQYNPTLLGQSDLHYQLERALDTARELNRVLAQRMN